MKTITRSCPAGCAVVARSCGLGGAGAGEPTADWLTTLDWYALVEPGMFYRYVFVKALRGRAAGDDTSL